MRIIDTRQIEECVCRLARKACVRPTPSCMAALKEAARTESSPTCVFALETLIKNAGIAKKEEMPVCQDTGMSVVLIDIGQDVSLSGPPVADAVNSGVRRAYADGCFRKSVCDPLTRVNTGDNTPAVIHYEMTEGENIKVTFIPKGFGSENMSRIYMLKPGDGAEGIIECIVGAVRDAGSRPCPPVYVGVGIGGTFESCTLLAKKALVRPVGTNNARSDVAAIEKEALKRINDLHIGCQGFGGDVTALGVACEISPTHIAGLPVAVNMQCNCIRCETEVL